MGKPGHVKISERQLYGMELLQHILRAGAGYGINGGKMILVLQVAYNFLVDIDVVIFMIG